MRLLVAIDDTDSLDSDHGTGWLSRDLAAQLANDYALSWRGCVRQQFLVDPRVPYTTHNSAACMLFDCPDDFEKGTVIPDAGTYLRETMADEADPGLCVADAASVPSSVTAFGRRATEEVVEKSDAYDVASAADVFLEEYGGTGDGVIGALGAVGLTVAGDTGRFIAYDGIREYDETVAVEQLRDDGIRVVNAEGDVIETGTVDTYDWIRPELRSHGPVLPVEMDENDHFRPANLH